MKNLLVVTTIILVLALVSSPVVIGKSAGNPMFSTVYAIDSTGICDSARVDIYGNYKFLNLKPGVYTFKFQKPGCNDILLTDVNHFDQSLDYHAALDFTMIYAESETEVEIPLVVDDYPHVIELTGIKPESMEISGARRGISKRMDDFSEMSSEHSVAAISISKSRGGSRSYSPDFGAKDDAVEDGVFSDYTTTETIGESEKKPMESAEKAGQLTAGIWSDLNNWEKWKETHSTDGIKNYQNEWNFHPENRFSVRFLDANGKAIVGKKVALIDQHGTTHWNAITDNTGRAELWSNLNAEITTQDIKEFKVKITAGERVFDFKTKPFSGSTEVMTIPLALHVNPIAEIAFVVDATGSMGDEIRYLQAELLDVITRVKKSNTCLDMRIGSVFYRDNGDEYVTVKTDFSSNPLNVIDFIYDQAAGGGGDFPEAVDAAMETTINELTWSENTISKMMFLVLDAPPHSDSSSVEKMNRYTKLAAEKGIKIIPVVASGINQSTEFLMKYLAVATNGTYIYITDHSGIGNSHEKPTGVKENVQYLNDLLVDVINENTAWEGCTDTVTNAKPTPGTVEIVTNGQWQAQFYPNPAKDYITVTNNLIPDKIQLFSISGSLIKTVEQLGEKVTIDVRDLSTGVYLVKCIKGEQQITCRMLVMH